MAKDREPPLGPDEDRQERTPWWAEDAPDEADLPEGFPERPDLARVNDLRSRMHRERVERRGAGRGKWLRRFDEKAGKQARDVGTYTLIPSLMLAGPAVGYGLGWLVERYWGGKPYVGVCGILFGLVAAFHQIFLLLKKNAKR